jgi:hypothetical protein
MLMGILFIILILFSTILYKHLDGNPIANNNIKQISKNQTSSGDYNNIEKFILGPKKIPFCISADYVDSITHYNDGTPIINLVMFLPDLVPSAVYDKLHPIPNSPILWSPERIEYSHSILQIEVTSSYSGESDPTGKLALMDDLKGWMPFVHPASTYPVEGFDEYDDRFGQPEIYLYKGLEPYGISCFQYACYVDFVMNDSLKVSISIVKPSIPSSLDIIQRFEKLVNSTECPQ